MNGIYCWYLQSWFDISTLYSLLNWMTQLVAAIRNLLVSRFYLCISDSVFGKNIFILPTLGWDHLSQAGSEWLEVSAGGCGDCLCLTEGRVETQQTQSSLLLSNNLSRLGSCSHFPLLCSQYSLYQFWSSPEVYYDISLAWTFMLAGREREPK